MNRLLEGVTGGLRKSTPLKSDDIFGISPLTLFSHISQC